MLPPHPAVHGPSPMSANVLRVVVSNERSEDLFDAPTAAGFRLLLFDVPEPL